jgi:hypothetical protein
MKTGANELIPGLFLNANFSLLVFNGKRAICNFNYILLYLSLYC